MSHQSQIQTQVARMKFTPIGTPGVRFDVTLGEIFLGTIMKFHGKWRIAYAVRVRDGVLWKDAPVQSYRFTTMQEAGSFLKRIS